MKLIQGTFGKITAAQVAEAVNADDVHKAHTSLVCLENTSNRGGGSCYEMKEMQAIREVCDDQKLKLHLDGARLFNAIVAKNGSAEQYGKTFHSISICLSKSLGCPVGSVLIGEKDIIKKARRIRKAFGGGMRQAGYMAAAGIYALKNNVQRLEQDHQHAQQIAAALKKKDFTGDMLPVETNIIIFSVKGRFTPKALVAKLKESGILAFAISPTAVRLVLHLDITPEMVQKTIETINKL